MENEVELHELWRKGRMCGEAWSVPLLLQVVLWINPVKQLKEDVFHNWSAT